MGKTLKVAISGATIWGNRGAEAMLTTTIGKLRERFPGSTFFVYSYSAKRDRTLVQDPDVVILSNRPLDLVLVYFPASFLCWFFNLFRLKIPGFLLPRGIRALRACDVLLDLAGISFVDGRELFLPFNILTIWPAMVQEVPVVKLAQALGPFNKTLNRRAAQMVLANCRHIYARGRVTLAHLDTLHLGEDQKSLAADVGFLYEEAFSLSAENETRVKNLLESLKRVRPEGRSLIGLSPSSLVYEKAISLGRDYIEIFLDLIDAFSKESDRNEYVIIPNATRHGVETPRNNDLFVIDEIHKRARKVFSDDIYQRIHWVTYDVNTASIRKILSLCEILITSRFHAMVAGLALGVPTLVISWSHKYGEVLEAIGLERWEIGFDDPEMDVVASASRLMASRDEIRQHLAANVDRLKNLSEVQFRDLEKWLS
jgi:colanic acid/amylovoran biosynthesis protein